MDSQGSPGPDPRLGLLIVDDHERARRALARRLETHPSVRVAGQTDDVLEARRIVLDSAPHVALVDFNRNDGLGPRLVSSLAALDPERRPLIVLHVAYFNPEHWEHARAAGADDLLLKRLGVDGVVSALFSAVRRAMPPERWPALLHG